LDGPETDPVLPGIILTFLLSYYPMGIRKKVKIIPSIRNEKMIKFAIDLQYVKKSKNFLNLSFLSTNLTKFKFLSTKTKSSFARSNSKSKKWLPCGPWYKKNSLSLTFFKADQ